MNDFAEMRSRSAVAKTSIRDGGLMLEALADELRQEQADILTTIIDVIPSGVSLFDANLRMVACNEQFKRLFDFTPTIVDGGLPTMGELAIHAARRGCGSDVHEIMAQHVTEHVRGIQPHGFECTRPNGTVLAIRIAPLPGGLGFVAIYTDITEHKRVEQYEKLRSQTLELVAEGQELHRVLEAIVRGVELLDPTMLCSISLLDKTGRHLDIVSAPSLPDFYKAAIDGIEIGMGVGSCGTAAFMGERIIVDDIATHPYWAPHKELAASAGLAACWSQVIRASSGQVLGTLAIHHHDVRAPSDFDISIIEQSARLAGIAIERSVAAEKLRESEALYRLLIEDVRDVVWKLDRDLRFIYISPADERLRGYRADEVIGHHVFEIFNEAGVAAVTELTRQRQVAERQGVQLGSMIFEAQHRCKDGSQLWGEIFCNPERDAHGAITGFHGITREITERKQMEEQVRQLVFYDTLTNLPNRRLLDDRISQAIAAGKRSGRYGALMFLDMDNFKPLNDKHGHEAGDLLLIEAADRLKKCVREMDTVARIGGDEFVVMLSDLSVDKVESKNQAKIRADEIRITLSEPYLLTLKHDGKAEDVVQHHCTVSIGVAMFTNDEGSAENILKWADAAMYEAKEAGRNMIRFYHSNTCEAA